MKHLKPFIMAAAFAAVLFFQPVLGNNETQAKRSSPGVRSRPQRTSQRSARRASPRHARSNKYGGLRPLRQRGFRTNKYGGLRPLRRRGFRTNKYGGLRPLRHRGSTVTIYTPSIGLYYRSDPLRTNDRYHNRGARHRSRGRSNVRSRWPRSLNDYLGPRKTDSYRRPNLGLTHYNPQYKSSQFHNNRINKPSSYYKHLNPVRVHRPYSRYYYSNVGYRNYRYRSHRGYGLIASLPLSCLRTVYRDEYYYHDGWNYYYPYNYNQTDMYEVLPPFKGVYIRELPDEALVVYIDGKVYYYYEGIFLVQVADRYQVVANPLEGLSEERIAQKDAPKDGEAIQIFPKP